MAARILVLFVAVLSFAICLGLLILLGCRCLDWSGSEGRDRAAAGHWGQVVQVEVVFQPVQQVVQVKAPALILSCASIFFAAWYAHILVRHRRDEALVAFVLHCWHAMRLK